MRKRRNEQMDVAIFITIWAALIPAAILGGIAIEFVRAALNGEKE